MNGNSLVLSLFPGIDLFGRGFEQAAYVVVRGPDLLLGQDIRDFKVRPGLFEGVIGGSPCPDFSKVRRSKPTGYGLEMMEQFKRVVTESMPDWFMLENVPGVPDLNLPGYVVFRMDVRASEFAPGQRRLRHIQFGSIDGRVPNLVRSSHAENQPAALANDGRSVNDLKRLMGLGDDFSLPSLNVAGAKRALGNAVPLPMAIALAWSVKEAFAPWSVRLCLCGCGRVATGKSKYGNAACRKRAQRKRDRARSSYAGRVTDVTHQVSNFPGQSHVTHRSILRLAKSHVTEPGENILEESQKRLSEAF